jgi:hypothetical protein
MAEESTSAPISKKKYFLVLASIMAVFYTVAPTLLGGVLSIVYPTKDVGLEMPLTGRVTNVWMNRQYYLYYLNGDRWVMHDFNAYVAADSADRRGMNDTLGYDPSSLAHYLRKGDYLIKAANSPTITVLRGRDTTRWILYKFTPEGQQPQLPQRRVVVVEGDTLELH